ncbi:MAG: aminopeptidase P family protein [Acidobacteriia bacterium]|nr:aminopeptidase P family protein [Terriglobia bacterium]
MFSREIYVRRREILRKSVKSGLLLFLGNEESPMNYPANQYTFRQDSSFLYYWGLDSPGLAAALDVDSGTETLFGDDPTVADIVWTGPQPLLRDRAASVGVSLALRAASLRESIEEAMRKGRTIHYLPAYRPENILKIEHLLGIHPSFAKAYASVEFTKAVVAQRSIKAPEEIAEIEKAINISCEMQTYAMKMARAGMIEREIAGAMHGIALARGGDLAFPIIFSIHGETLHNHYHGNVMQNGNIIVNDCGAESELHYAGDLTRTFPVSGKFTDRQHEVYRIVLDAQQKALLAIKPGVPHREIHLLACRTLASGLKQLGLMKGDVNEAVEHGAHAMFFQCGLGHMMGLDVHDMEDLGEQHVGYAGTQRSPQFGLCYLRLAAPLRAGFVITCEPGIYFIPALIEQWKAERKHEQFINYDMLERYRDFGGIRVEDDVLVTETGYRILGTHAPSTIEEVEAACAG